MGTAEKLKEFETGSVIFGGVHKVDYDALKKHLQDEIDKAIKDGRLDPDWEEKESLVRLVWSI